MANLKEIQKRINSIKDTLKITNAMYLIASSKLRKVRKKQADVSKYFTIMQNTMSDIVTHMPELKNRYFDDGNVVFEGHKKRAYIVVTADKGLAGPYNMSVIKLAEEKLAKHPEASLFVIGQIGRHYFKGKTDKFHEDFLYSSQNPSLQRARNITDELIELYQEGKIDEVSIIYTKMKNALQSEARVLELLPLKKQDFKRDSKELYFQTEGFYPSEQSVMNEVAPIYMHGIIFSALTESYCAELSDRMTAMDGATKNGKEMIQELSLLYNRTRQGAITQEITEVVGGARAQKKKKEA